MPRDVGEILDLVPRLVDYGENKLPPDCHLVAARESLWTLNVFVLSYSQIQKFYKMI